MRRIPLLAALVLLVPVATRADDLAHADFFEAKVRPILVARCQSCHGDEDPKGGLALTSRAALLAGGESGPAAVPGKPDESLLVEVIGYESEPRMPPKGRLPAPEAEALARWVQLGLPWPDAGTTASPPPGPAVAATPSADDHWAFQPVRPVPPPAVRDSSWLRSPIDAFVLARLEREGLSPAPEADRRTLARRLWVDLTGLPPTPAEVAAFVADSAPDAYERLVDRLLASPLHGQQWARHWLDVARYSDTKGYVYAREELFWVHAWAYRDWVVRALNDDRPYDEFLLLQLAADQLAADPADRPAMGFLTLGRRFLGVTHDIIDDRIDVVTRGTLAMTVACARCHDHKYDPIPTADYYSLSSIFRNNAERVVPAFDEATAGSLDAAYTAGLRERQEKLDAEMAKQRQAAADRVRARVADYLQAQLELGKYPEEGFDQILAPEDVIPTFVRRWRDALARAADRDDPVFRPWRELTRLPAEDFATRAAEVCRAFVTASPGAVHPLVARAFAEPPATLQEVAKRYGIVFDDIIKQWDETQAQAKREGKPAPQALPDPDAEALRRWLYGPDAPCEVPDEAIVDTEYYFPTAVCEALWKLQGDVDRHLIQSAGAPPYALLLTDRPIITNARVLRRGNPATPGEETPAHFLRALAGPDPSPFRQGSGRLELARAIVDPANPLTARVQVNRIWMHHFGAGLVTTPGDFGTRATPPSHPELLDWLAASFAADGWSQKQLHRLIVLSATYRQSTDGPIDPVQRAEAVRRDPENRWLWHHAPHRLTFEELRDALLAATGELDLRAGGKPAALLAAPFPKRRTLYGLVDRQDLPSAFRVFDFANPDLLIPQRSESTVPQQSLFLLNHPFAIERARALAARSAQGASDDPRERVRQLFLLAYQREPTDRQAEAALTLVTTADSEPAPRRPSPTALAWRYGYGRHDASDDKLRDFQPLPYFGGNAWQGGPAWPDAKLGWVQLNAEGGHPGNDRAHAAVRRWIAPRDMAVRIRSTLRHEVEAGDGVRGFIVSSERGTIARAEVHNGRAELNADRLEVRAGETIDFVVDIRDGLNSDQHLWAPVIEECDGESPLTWDARADFDGPAPTRLDPWEQLAQVLLLSNEFAFVD